jgi:hypothetical protein
MLQALYGRRKGPRPPDLCSESSFDAIFEYPAGVIYVLKGKISGSWLLSYLTILRELYILFNVT